MTSAVASARLLWTCDGLGVGLSFHSSVLQQSKKEPHLRYFWMQITKPNSSSFVRKAVRPPRRNGTGSWIHFRNPEEVSSLFLFSASLFLPHSVLTLRDPLSPFTASNSPPPPLPPLHSQSGFAFLLSPSSSHT